MQRKINKYNIVQYTKAWENVNVAKFGSYTWSGCEQRKGKHWLQGAILSPCQGRDCLEKEVRYASDLVLKHT